MDLIWGLYIALVGIVVVFVTLLLLQGVLQFANLLGRPRAKPVVASSADGDIPPEHLAIISAVIAAQSGLRQRVSRVSIRGRTIWELSRYTELSSFSQEG